MKKQADNIIDDLRTHLEYQKMMGIEEVPKSPPPRPSPLPPKDRRTGEGEGMGGGAIATLKKILTEIGDCKRCKLCKDRSNIVFGVGNPQAELMFIGEGPGADEDAQGEPFVGRAGQLLNKIIAAMGLKRGDTYIGNIVKCRPPNNRNPEPDEMETCMPFILKQIAAIRPKIIVCLGAIATKALLNTEVPISKLRGKLIDWGPKDANYSFADNFIFWSEKNIEPIDLGSMEPCKLMPTYHTAFLLRNPNMKRPVWEDMQKVMEFLGLKKPS